VPSVKAVRPQGNHRRSITLTCEREQPRKEGRLVEGSLWNMSSVTASFHLPQSRWLASPQTPQGHMEADPPPLPA
jgi:hypothetical protein